MFCVRSKYLLCSLYSLGDIGLGSLFVLSKQQPGFWGMGGRGTSKCKRAKEIEISLGHEKKELSFFLGGGCWESLKRRRTRRKTEGGIRGEGEDCQQPVTKKYYAIDRNRRQAIVCEQHYYIHTLCARCGELLIQIAEESIQEVDGLRYHEQCVQCPGCLLAKRASCHSGHSVNGGGSTNSASGFNNWRVVNRLSRSSKTNNSTSNYDGSTLNEPLVDSRPEYKYDNKSYCRYHYSLLRGTGCTGCGQAILSQPVDDKTEPGKHWHHECFMIYKYWQVKLADPLVDHHGHYITLSPGELIEMQQAMEKKRTQLWKELRDFENSLATCIYDLALHITAGSYQESVTTVTQLAWHLRTLLSAHQSIHAIYRDNQILVANENPPCVTWSRLIGSQIIQLFRFFDTMDLAQKESSGKTVIDFVRSLAYNLKAFLLEGIKESLKLDITYGIKNSMSVFLDGFVELRKNCTPVSGRYIFKEQPFPEIDGPSTGLDTRCQRCLQNILDDCFCHGNGRWHTTCLECNACKTPISMTSLARVGYATQSNSNPSAVIMLCDRCTMDPRNRQHFLMQNAPIMYVSQLDQYKHLLRVELARVKHQQGEEGKQKEKQKKPQHQQHRGTLSFKDKAGGGLFSKSRPALQMDTSTLTLARAQSSQTTPSPLSPTRRTTIDTMQLSDQKQGMFGSLYLPGVRRAWSTQGDNGMTAAATTTTNMIPRRAMTVHVEESRMNPSLPTSPTGASPISPTRTNSAGNKLSHSLRRALSQNRRQQQQLQHLQQQQHGGDIKSKRMAEVSTAQDILVRNLGAIYVQRYVHPYLDLDELASCLDCKKETMWSKVKLHLWGSTPTAPQADHGKVFGVSLATVAKQKYRHPADQAIYASSLRFLSEHHPLFVSFYMESSMTPVIIQDIILSLLQQDLAVEGIFRKNGNIRDLKETSIKVDKGDPYMEVLVHKSSSIQLAALLKRYLRDLPEPLLTFKLYKLFITSLRKSWWLAVSKKKKEAHLTPSFAGMSNEEEAKCVLHLACCMLPKPNRDVLQLLFLFLNHVASFKDKNLMDSHNLAVILTPSVFYAPPTSSSSTGRLQPRTSKEEIEVVDMLIRYQPDFTMIPADIVMSTQDANMIKTLYSSDISSKEFLRAHCDTLTRSKKVHHREGILPLATRSEVTLSSIPFSPQVRKI
ncbi:hypothetical protein BX666DRAFT_2108646 [Dichotomocladium elegans]|nr:hypothetical protein BX666DRAFT_2108646 [Dichotomocladium elegans]